MSVEVPSLRSLLDRYAEVDGVTKLIILHQMRTYFATIPVERGVQEILELKSSKELDIVTGAGLRGKFYYACLCRKLQLGDYE